MDIESLLQAFDRLALGVLLIDRRGRLSFANRSGAEILGIAPGRSDASDAEANRDAGTEAMHALMRKERGTRDALIYPHPVDGRPLQVFSTPLEWPDAPSEISGQYAQAVFLSDPKTAGNPIGVLRELYDLTPQETRLALLLLADRSLTDAAGNLGIQKSTAKSMLKSLFAKTGVKRQTSLVRLLLSGPGMFREDSKAVSAATPAATRRQRE
jgi:DNA-binding CsgD family transcriptional regulator